MNLSKKLPNPTFAGDKKLSYKDLAIYLKPLSSQRKNSYNNTKNPKIQKKIKIIKTIRHLQHQTSVVPILSSSIT